MGVHVGRGGGRPDLALGFGNLLGACWRYYYLDAPGSRAALEFFVVPAAFILALGCAAVVARADMRRVRGRVALGLLTRPRCCWRRSSR